MKIVDLQKDMTTAVVAVVDKVNQAVTNTGSPYLNIVLKDKSGTLDAKLWDAKNEDIQAIKKGVVLEANLTLLEYRNSLQGRLLDYKVVAEHDIDINDFVAQAPIDANIMFDELLDTINNLQNKTYQQIMLLVLNEYGEKFKIWPAAIRNHHEIKSGLLWHTWSMFKTAKAMSEIYSDREIDFELLYCGIILHDLGKVFEITPNISYEFSLEGKLIGHISIMVNELHRIAKQANMDDLQEITLLKHMIIASHGRLEYGSPVEPHLLEAEILSFIDNLDARIYRVEKELQRVNYGEQTQRIIPAENRWYIRHYNKESDSDNN